jgi:6-phosphogluconolactonase
MIEAEWWEFEDRAALAEQVADDVEFLIERAIAGRGHALLAVTGGRMPEPVFKVLTKRKIDWSKVVLTLTDDRLVPAKDPLSNFGLLTRMAGKTGAKLVPLVGDPPADDPQAAGRAADQALADCTGRRISSGSASARTATPPRSSPAPTSPTRPPAPRPAAPSASAPIRCPRTRPSRASRSRWRRSRPPTP